MWAIAGNEGNVRCGGALQILEAVEVLREQGWEYRLEASYVEVYNEALRDLLAAGNTKRDGARLLDGNAIKHDPPGEAAHNPRAPPARAPAATSALFRLWKGKDSYVLEESRPCILWRIMKRRAVLCCAQCDI